MTHVLDKQARQFPNLESQIEEMKSLYNSKLWYQLSTLLLKYIEEPALQADNHLIELYQDFFKEIESNVDELMCVQLVTKASDQYKDLDTKLSFLKKINDTVLSDPAAKLLNRTKMAAHKLDHGKLDDTLQDIRELTKTIEGFSDLDPIVYSSFYHLTAAYYAKKRNYDEFYKNSLQYLAYTNEEKIKPEDKVRISVDMGIAVLVSENIYNFSELLEQPVLKALVNTPNRWVYNLLQTFNAGDIKQYETDRTQYHKFIEQNELMKANLKVLDKKIQIMSLLELIFTRPKNDRNVTFESIAKVAGIKVDDVELLVIKTMSLQLIKGSIDQVEKKVRVTWVMPRVLDLERIDVMKKKFDQWNHTLDNLVKIVESGNFSVSNFL